MSAPVKQILCDHLDPELLYQLLRRVGGRYVVWHTVTDVHAPGFAWTNSDMSLPQQDLCASALRDHLLDIGVHRDGACPVFLTSLGEDRLKGLRAQHDEAVRGAA